MKQYFGNHLGLCVNNNDPEKRGRVQVFIPHIMPLLFENWNEVGEDIKMVCVGDNIPDSLPAPVLEKLIKILPWAEAASPILGTSAPGSLVSAGEGSNYYDQSPVPVARSLGTGQFNSNSALYTALTDNAFGGYCARGVANILASQGLGNFRGLNAHDFPGRVASQGWVKLPNNITPYNAPEGALLIFNSDSRLGKKPRNKGGGLWGHVELIAYDKNGNRKYVSDKARNGPGGSVLDNYMGAWVKPGSTGGGVPESVPGVPPPPTQTGPERTSTSGSTSTWNPLQDSTGVDADTSSPIFGSFVRPEVGGTSSGLSVGPGAPGTEQPPGSISNKLAQDRQAYFQNELAGNAQLAQDLYTRAYREVGSNVTNQQMWLETVANRALFSGRSLSSVVNDNRYFPPASFRPIGTPPVNFNNALVNVFQRGSNLTNLATDNASADVAARRQAAGVTGAWLGVGGSKEFYYRSDAAGTKYATAAGLAAAQYAQTNGINFDPQGNPYLAGSQSPGSEFAINNPDPHPPTASMNLNHMAAGFFSYPAAGALLWVFFREGNPLYPVYFAVNYGQKEWQSAYRYTMASPPEDVDGYKPGATPESPVTSVGGVWNIGKSGGIKWGATTDPNDSVNDERQLMIEGYDGSNMFFNIGYHQIFSKFDRRDQVDGDRWETTGGYKEEAVQGDRNVLVSGDVFIKIGNISTPAVDAVTRIQQIIGEIMQPLAEPRPGDCEQGGGGGGGGETPAKPPSQFTEKAKENATMTPSKPLDTIENTYKDGTNNILDPTKTLPFPGFPNISNPHTPNPTRDNFRDPRINPAVPTTRVVATTPLTPGSGKQPPSFEFVDNPSFGTLEAFKQSQAQ